MEVIIDMGKETVIRNISAEFMQFLEPWVHMPSNITIYTSNDNVNYQLLSDEPLLQVMKSISLRIMNGLEMLRQDILNM